MKRLLPLLLLLASPAYADAMPDGTPDPGRTAAPRGSVSWRPDGARVPGGGIGQARPGVLPSPLAQPESMALVAVTPDADARADFLPIPHGGTIRWRQWGGGLARVWNGAPEDYVPPLGPVAYALAAGPGNNNGGNLQPGGNGSGNEGCGNGNGGPNRPDCPQPPGPKPPTPKPPDPRPPGHGAPGPLGVAGAVAAFGWRPPPAPEDRQMSKAYDVVYRPCPTHPFFCYSDEGDGLTCFRTEEERNVYVEEEIQSYLSESEWFEEVTDVKIGVISFTHAVQECDQIYPVGTVDEDGYDEDGTYWHDPDSYACNYKMVPIKQED